jgi:NAD(P)-dependent dehydrogenase (short-subunit alcohol dehydrogenase family)
MSGKVLLVTGGGRGIGAATCRLAARQGYSVAVNYLGNTEAAETLAAEIARAGGRAVAIRADVSREADVERLFGETETQLGPLTHLVNNAAMTGRASRLDEVSTETLEAVFDLNILGAFLCARGGQASLDAPWRQGRCHRQPLLGRRLYRQPRRMGVVRGIEGGHRHADLGLGPRAGARQGTRQRRGARLDRHRPACQLRHR